ncbi:hypothetical protein Mapa_010693 [Marchantia paleacea]|nr:hypothetical protein Mapa_010693 [Marchantia paleacea]
MSNIQGFRKYGIEIDGMDVEGEPRYQDWDAMMMDHTDDLELDLEVESPEDVEMVQRIERVAEDVLENMGEADRGFGEGYLEDHCEFNFLGQKNIFLVHAAASFCASGICTFRKKRHVLSDVEESPFFTDCVIKFLKKLIEGNLRVLRYICNLKDSRGRPPIHVAADHHSIGRHCKGR